MNEYSDLPPINIISLCDRRREYLLMQMKSSGVTARGFRAIEEIPLKWKHDGIIIVSDGGMNEAYFADIFQRLSCLCIPLPVVAAIFDEPKPADVVSAVKLGALDFLVFPLEPTAVRKRLDALRDEAERFRLSQLQHFNAAKLLQSLTKRERQILTFLSEGATSADIGVNRGITLKTVEVRRANIRAKFGSSRIADAVRVFFYAQK